MGKGHSKLLTYAAIGGIGVVGLVLVAVRSNNQALSQFVFGNPIARAISGVLDKTIDRRQAQAQSAYMYRY